MRVSKWNLENVQEGIRTLAAVMFEIWAFRPVWRSGPVSTAQSSQYIYILTTLPSSRGQTMVEEKMPAKLNTHS
jgi:hypothetical protein